MGRAGGTVSDSSGLTLEFPANALGSDTNITILPATVSAPAGAVTAVYTFGPAGATFALPVKVTFPVPAGTQASEISVYWTKAGSPGQWESLPTTLSGTTAAAEVNHFSSGFVGLFCSTGSSCVPANPCHSGTTSCNGTPACVDSGVGVADGAVCCTSGLCTGGTCLASSSDGTFLVTSVRCAGVPAVGRMAAWTVPPSTFRITSSGAVGHTIFSNGSCTITQLHGVIGTWACSPSPAACLGYSTSLFGGQICGMSYDDTGPAPEPTGPVLACPGTTMTLAGPAGGTQCGDMGGGSDPISFVLLRQ